MGKFLHPRHELRHFLPHLVLVEFNQFLGELFSKEAGRTFLCEQIARGNAIGLETTTCVVGGDIEQLTCAGNGDHHWSSNDQSTAQ